MLMLLPDSFAWALPFARLMLRFDIYQHQKQVVPLGKVTGIELNHKHKEIVKRGEPSVAVKIEVASYETPKTFGRHFDENSELYSHISRESIDILKSVFRNDLTKEEWKVVVDLKKILGIS